MTANLAKSAVQCFDFNLSINDVMIPTALALAKKKKRKEKTYYVHSLGTVINMAFTTKTINLNLYIKPLSKLKPTASPPHPRW
jgi:Na+/serine symporter